MKTCKKHGLIIPYLGESGHLFCGLCWKEQEQKNPFHWEECENNLEHCSICQQIFMEEIV